MATDKLLIFQVAFAVVCLAQESTDNIPEPQLTYEWKNIFASESTVLKCKIQPDSESWNYKWYRNGESLSENGNAYSVSSATKQNAGVYTCQGTHKKRNVTSKLSKAVELILSDLPTAQLNVESKWTKVFSTESVVMKCEIQPGSTDWRYKWYRNGQEVPDPTNGNKYSISRTNKEHSGEYTCQGVHSIRTVTTSGSNVIQLTVDYLPTAQLNVESKWTKVFSTESVVMKCEIQPSSTDWRYKWYRNGQEVPDPTNGNKYSISRTNKEHSGEYTCQGVHSIRTVATGGSNVIQLTVDDLPTAQLNVESKWTKVFSTERVVMKCEIQPGSRDWRYKWYKNGQEVPDPTNGNKYSISRTNKEHSGKYTCQGVHSIRTVTTSSSNVIQLTVDDLPTAQLNVESKWTKVFSTESVVMKCEIQPGSTYWRYKWYKNGQEVPDPTNGNKYSISRTNKEHSGEYTCQGVHSIRTVTTSGSNVIQLNVDDLPTPHLNVESKWTKVFSTERVVMKCEIQPGSRDWRYKWYKNGQEVPDPTNGNKYSISRTNKEHSGKYTCQGVHSIRTVTTSSSNVIQLTIDDLPTPHLNVESKWTKVFSTESVIMKCEIQPSSTDWRYKWYRNGQEVPDPTNGNKYSISRTNKEHSGEYTCQGVHSIRTVATGGSNVIQLTVDDLPVPQLTSDWRNVFSSQPVDLKCRIQPDSTNWDYIWYRNGQTFSVSGNVDTHSISSTTKGHAGQYACQGNHRTRLVTTETSKKFHLLVSDLPKPHLTLESKWTRVYPSEKVNMMCDIQPNSTDWHYKWYRNGQEFLYTMDGQKIDSDKKRLIQLASSGQSGNYTCVGKHKTMPVSTTTSNMIDLYVYDDKLVPVVRQYPSFEFMYEEEEVTLQCEVAYLPSIWKYHWFKKTGSKSHEKMNYTFNSTRHMNNDQFFCESERDTYRSERSRPVNLLVKPLPSASLTVDTSWTDILSVDSLTLLCEVHYKDNYGWNFTWFRDGTQLSDSFQERLSVKTTEDMYQSEFQCKGFRTERPTSSTFSEAFKANNLAIEIKPEPDLFISMQDTKSDALLPCNRYSYAGGRSSPTEEHHKSEELLCMSGLNIEQTEGEDETANHEQFKSFRG
ncbi:Fc receptor-like protein 5 isoform X2 [Denticeps clupeoides]|uniref:Fc receptor-like protein 5 isoform X2 n=1 Tax=Denticeps clupeoides TaxID=299321 RepID=UPI0010A53F34|nr:Fc receptor-like protein 5 isoform X2 [Denticeps clupeoides]